ncbi:hypothetical protein, partial [Brachyspira alvinipulli]|uniref:hypothetical protein n=1 Tax=Brachyspira alvinipulli TaxID=84379 RepID=UPI00056E17DC
SSDESEELSLSDIEEGLEELEELEDLISESSTEDIQEEISEESPTSLDSEETESYLTNAEELQTASNEKPLSLEHYTLIDSEEGGKIKRSSYAKDDIELKDAVFSEEQNYVVEHIYSEEQNELIEEIKEKDAISESDIDSLEVVEDFDLHSHFSNPIISNEDKQNEDVQDEIEVPNLDDNIDVPVDLAFDVDEDLELPELEDEVPEEIDLTKEDNLKEKELDAEYDDRNVIIPDIDSIDYIDESNYINEMDSETDDIIQLSGNELDLITKDLDITDSQNNNVEDDILNKVIEEEIIDDYREDNYTLSEINDEDLEEIDDGYVNENEDGIMDDY